jgi:hypothetical protein
LYTNDEHKPEPNAQCEANYEPDRNTFTIFDANSPADRVAKLVVFTFADSDSDGARVSVSSRRYSTGLPVALLVILTLRYR